MEDNFGSQQGRTFFTAHGNRGDGSSGNVFVFKDEAASKYFWYDNSLNLWKEFSPVNVDPDEVRDIAATSIAVAGGIVSAGVMAEAGVMMFLAKEAGEAILEEVTGIPIIPLNPDPTDVLDPLINKGAKKVLRPLSDGELFERQVQETFKKKIIRKNEPLIDKAGKQIGEIDFETSDALVEVGLSLEGKLRQIQRLAKESISRGKRVDVIFDVTKTPQKRVDEFKRILQKDFGNRVKFIPSILVKEN